MDIKKGDTVKIIEKYAKLHGKLGRVMDVFESKWSTDIAVEFILTNEQASEYHGSRVIYDPGIQKVIVSEIYQPFQLLRVPSTKLGKLLYV